MTLPWEHEVRLYPPDAPPRLVGALPPEALDIGADLAVIAACTCGEWARAYGASLAARTAWDEIARHEAEHAAMRPALDPELAVTMARAILARGGRIAPGECRYCHVRVECFARVGEWPTWVAVGRTAVPAPAMYCPAETNPMRDVLPGHLPVKVDELVALDQLRGGGA